MDEKKPTVVFSGDFENANWLFDVLQAVVLLQCHQQSAFDVVFLPTKSFVGRVFRLAKRVWRRMGRLPLVPVRTQVATEIDPDSMYRRFARGETLTLPRPGGPITLRRAKVSLPQQIRCTGVALAGTLRIWRRTFARPSFRATDLLTATFRGVRVGDLAASSFFNSEFGVGDVQPHPYLFYTLFEACYLVALAERLTKRTGSQPYFAVTPEPSYTSAAAYRCFYKCGAAAIDVYQRCHVIAVVPPTNSPPANGPTLNSVPRPARQLSPESRTRVEQYFKLRLSSAAKVLAHMRYGENDNTARELVDYEGNPASLTEDRVHCAIFLHSFADAQYYYGLDGFDSLSHWLFHSIDACLVNKGIATVVIKPHPSETYRGMHTDAVILREIMQRYGSNERVLLLHPKASLTRLCSSAPLVGITNHGSVAEELVYLGQPVIASVFAPWGEHYRFARLWKTQEQYDELIKSINPDSWTPPTEEEKEELVHFILDQRVCELPSDRRLPRRILALLESRAGVQAGAPAPNDDHAQHLMGLDNLRLDDARLAALLREFEKLPAFIPPAVLQHRPRA